MTETTDEAVTAIWVPRIHPANREETNDWCATHGLDADAILENGARVLRRGSTLIFEYDQMLRDEEGHPILQGHEIARVHKQVEVNAEPPPSEWMEC